VQGDPITCSYIRSKAQYEAALEDQKRQQWKGASKGCYAEMKEELQELKQTNASVADDLSKLKQGLDVSRKCYVDSSVVLSVSCGFVGIVVGVLLCQMFK
jgi:hypothetical protein